MVRKKKVRAGYRASTTRILGQIDPAVTTEPLEVPKITQLRRSLEDKLTSLTALDNEILPLLDKEAIEAEIVQADEIKEQVYAALSKLEVALKPGHTTTRAAGHAPTSLEPTPETSRTDSETAGDDEATPTTCGARVKLPKISLPRFGGDPVKWTTFWDSYQSAIHGNDGLSDVDIFLSTSQNVRTDPRCCYCEQSHPSSSCPTVISSTDRKHILKTSGRCYNCLRKNHLSRSCKSTSRCLKC